MTRQEAFEEINNTQEYYINELIKLMNDKDHASFKELSFTSPTGTGKTKMMSLLINKLPQYFFIVTTLSKGQLNIQIKNSLAKDCNQNNYIVYGSCDYRINSKLQAQDILDQIPAGTECIWLRDEGHIRTNRFEQLLEDRCYKVINFSATNVQSDITCNFTNTMMLRTVSQQEGTPKDALNKLVEIKNAHAKVSGYNPCALFRCIDNNIAKKVIALCKKYNLKYINITEEYFDMSDLCRDDNEYDVIINKFKITEGIDIRRAHVLYVDNQPSNTATTIQVIGRCRRNALLYRNDIDILDDSNKALLKATRKCYVYYNVTNMKISSDTNGELAYAFCEYISCQKLKPNSIISVVDGEMTNGLHILELAGQTGNYEVLIDKATGFNIIKPEGPFYDVETTTSSKTISIDVRHNEYRYRNAVPSIETIIIPKEDIIKNWSLQGNNYSSRLLIEKAYTLILSKAEIDYIKQQAKKLAQKEIQFESVSTYYAKRKTKSKGVFYRTKNFIPYSQVQNTIVITEELLTIICRNIFTITDTNELYRKQYNQETGEYFTTALDRQGILDSIATALSKRADVRYLSGETDFTTKQEAVDYINANIDNYKKYHKNLIKLKISLQTEILIRTKNKVDLIDTYRTQNNIKKYGKLSREYLVACSAVKDNLQYKPYTKQINDKESAIIGTDIMQQYKDQNTGKVSWKENRAVTKKVRIACKLNTFLETRYEQQIKDAQQQIFTGKNNFSFDSKCNSCLGYVVEFYSKYLVYGKSYLEKYFNEIRKEKIGIENMRVNNLNTDEVIVRACMLKYRDLMKEAFGDGVARLIPTMSVSQLLKNQYKTFIKTVVDLGTKVANYVKQNLYSNRQAVDEYDPNLSIRHIAGLADYITEDTILDVKVTNYIDIAYVKQVLTYHYLSTKRSDLNIKHLIIFDAVSGKAVKIDL